MLDILVRVAKKKTNSCSVFFVSLICTIALIAHTSPCLGQSKSASASRDQNWNVLGGEVDGVPVDKLLKNYQLEQLRPHFAARKAAIQSIDTPRAYLARQEVFAGCSIKSTDRYQQKRR